MIFPMVDHRAKYLSSCGVNLQSGNLLEMPFSFTVAEQSFLSHLSMMKIALVLAVLTAIVAAETSKCVVQDGSDTYNFNRLARTNDYNFDYYNGATRYNIQINFCQPLGANVCGNNTAICQTWTGASASLGNFATLDVTAGSKGSYMDYTGGSQGRRSTVDLICDPSVAGMNFTFVNENPTLTYNFAIRSALACPSGVSALAPFFALILACIFFQF